jgi:protein-tyrosine phosphatase
LDLQAHRARQFDQAQAQAHDLVLVMEQYQRQWIEQSFPYLRGRVHLLGKWNEHEIADPFRKGPQAFDVAMGEIVQAVASWRPRLT